MMELEQVQAMVMIQVKRAQQLQKKYHNKQIKIHNLKSFKKSDWMMLFDAIR